MRIKNFSWKYWLVPVFLIICQLAWTFSSTSQIRFEEVAESVRNVFWLQNQSIYDGISSNVGWYGTLLIIYKIFGFSLFTAKFYRLFLFIVSIVMKNNRFTEQSYMPRLTRCWLMDQPPSRIYPGGFFIFSQFGFHSTFWKTTN